MIFFPSIKKEKQNINSVMTVDTDVLLSASIDLNGSISPISAATLPVVFPFSLPPQPQHPRSTSQNCHPKSWPNPLRNCDEGRFLQLPPSADQIPFPHCPVALPPIGMAADPHWLAMQRRFGLLALQTRSSGGATLFLDRCLKFGDLKKRGFGVGGSPSDPNCGELLAAGLFVGCRVELCV